MTRARSFPSGLLLAIDTCAERCSAALMDLSDQSILVAVEPVIGRGHAERLMGVIETALAQAGAAYRDLSRIAVCVGPGSFTGIRVGVAAARGLALSLGIPAVGVSSLEALAEPWIAPGRDILVVQDARRGELFAALHRDGAWSGEPRALVPTDLPAFCDSVAQARELRLVGTGAPVAERFLAGRFLSFGDDSGAVDTRAVARIGAGRAEGPPPSPLYLRGADAKPQAGAVSRVPNPAELR